MTDLVTTKEAAIIVTTAEAADEAHVGESTIRAWASRGLLTRIGKRGRMALYDLAEVMTVERDTRIWTDAHGGAQGSKATRRQHA